MCKIKQGRQERKTLAKAASSTQPAPPKRSEPGEPSEKVCPADGRRFNNAFRLGPDPTRRPPSPAGDTYRRPPPPPSPTGRQLLRRGTAPPPRTCLPPRAGRARCPAGWPAAAPRRRAGQGRAGGVPNMRCRSPAARSMRPARCITPPCPCPAWGSARGSGEEVVVGELLTSSHLTNLMPFFRVSETQTGLSWRACTPGCAPAICTALTRSPP